jgi:hypothetical protein
MDAEWSRQHEAALRAALRLPSNRRMVEVLVRRYCWEYADLVQELRVRAFSALLRKPQFASSTVIYNAVRYGLMHMCRYEGKRHLLAYRDSNESVFAG